MTSAALRAASHRTDRPGYTGRMAQVDRQTGVSLGERIRAAGGRVTALRLEVLRTLETSDRTLTHQEIEDACREAGLDPDRVTVYRILDWLVDKNLAHKVSGPDRAWRFGALPGVEHEHAHFHCSDCGHVFCLEDAPAVASPSLPPGFRLEKLEVAVAGRCPGCVARERKSAGRTKKPVRRR